MVKIKSFDVTFSKDEIASFTKKAEAILNNGALIPGQNNLELEEKFAQFTDCKYSVAVNTGTTALEIIFRVFNLENTEVLLPTNTNYATADAVLRAGAKPTLYDSNLYPDFNSIKERVTTNTKALVVVHVGGYISPEMERIVQYCLQENILLVEDASHAHGSRLKNKSAGSFGDASAFSMFATKVITTSEGGMIVSDNPKVRKLSPIYRDQGKDSAGLQNIMHGSAWRMSELHAALGLVQLPNLLKYLKRNNEIVKTYVENLSTSKLVIPFEKDCFYSGYKFVVLTKSANERSSLKKYLLKNGIKPAKGIYDYPLHKQPALNELNTHEYPKAEEFADTHLCLPIWKGLTNSDLEYIIETVNEWSTK